VAAIFPAARYAFRTAPARAAISGIGQPYGGDALRRNAFAPAGEAQPLGGRGLDADLIGTQAGDFGNSGDHLGAVRPDLRPLANDRYVEMSHDPAALGDGRDGMLEKKSAVGSAPTRIGRWKMAADIAKPDAAQNRVGQCV